MRVSILAILLAALAASHTAWAQSGEIPCAEAYPAVAGMFAAAERHGSDGLCYACPDGHRRTERSLVSPQACQLAGTATHSKAEKHDKAAGSVAKACPKGQFLSIRDGHCYSCPPGAKRTISAITSPRACVLRAAYAKAIPRGSPFPCAARYPADGTFEAAFRRPEDGKCHACPTGYAWKGKACQAVARKAFAASTRAGKGPFCKGGARFSVPKGHCYRCPPGHRWSVVGDVAGAKACVKRAAKPVRAAVRREK